MLVLSRRTDESVMISGNIEVHVLRIEQGQVRLGFTAPPEVKVLRTELTDKPVTLDNAETKKREKHRRKRL